MNIERHEVKVTYSDGDYFYTAINGSREEIAKYYNIGSRWNVGTETDVFKIISRLEFLK